jgi:hypothetical protein
MLHQNKSLETLSMVSDARLGTISYLLRGDPDTTLKYLWLHDEFLCEQKVKPKDYPVLREPRA